MYYCELCDEYFLEPFLADNGKDEICPYCGGVDFKFIDVDYGLGIKEDFKWYIH